jgi:hypothetical protein
VGRLKRGARTTIKLRLLIRAFACKRASTRGGKSAFSAVWGLKFLRRIADEAGGHRLSHSRNLGLGKEVKCGAYLF